MSSNLAVAKEFFEACETGKGWDACASHCTADAAFSAQAAALSGITTLADYTEWMKGLLVTLPDGIATARAFAIDWERDSVTVYGVFRGTHTGAGGPVPPTGRAAEADYVYVMEFDGDKISHLTKIWNDGYTLAQLGWV